MHSETHLSLRTASQEHCDLILLIKEHFAEEITKKTSCIISIFKFPSPKKQKNNSLIIEARFKGWRNGSLWWNTDLNRVFYSDFSCFWNWAQFPPQNDTHSGWDQKNFSRTPRSKISLFRALQELIRGESRQWSGTPRRLFKSTEFPTQVIAYISFW